jgi:very-short-patch-repair endonuclease
MHWADLDENEVDGLVTTPLRTVVDCFRTMPFADALAVADSALRRELIDADRLAAEAARLVGPGAPAARHVAALADGKAANPFESALRAIVLDAGLSDFVPQLKVSGRGFSAYVDLGDKRRRIALEADSFEWHGQRSALDRDCRRYDELVRRGWLVLRFSWEQVMFDRAWVAEVVADAVAFRRLRRPRVRPVHSGRSRGQNARLVG